MTSDAISPLPPVFGALRSGTTLLRLMLKSHPEIQSPGEADFLFDHISHTPGGGWRYDREALALVAAMAAGTSGRLCLNIRRHAGRMAALFPDAQVIHLLCDPRDVARSSIGMGWAGNSYFGVDHRIGTERGWDEAAIPEARVLTVRYEMLMADLEAELPEIPVQLQLWTSDATPERLGVFALFYDWAKDGRGFPMIGSGNNRYQLLDVEDLCESIYLCATLDREIVNDTFNIGAKEFTTMKEDYQAVLDKAGYGKQIHGFPAAPMIWTLRVLEAFNLSPLYKWVYETAAEDSFVSIEKAEKKLGYKPKYSNKDALVRNYDWYVANLDKFENTSGVSHRVPWKQGVLGVAKMFF